MNLWGKMDFTPAIQFLTIEHRCLCTCSVIGLQFFRLVLVVTYRDFANEGNRGDFPVIRKTAVIKEILFASTNLMITIYEWPIKHLKNRSTAKYQHSKSASRGKQNRRFGGDLQTHGIVGELD